MTLHFPAAAADMQVVANSESKALKLSTERSGELPWNVASMCQTIVHEENKRVKPELPEDEGWKVLYSHCCWLCQIKHPTLAQSFHDAGSTSVNEMNYVVMAFPDVREEDLGVKKLICCMVLSRALSAIESFAQAAGVEDKTPKESRFWEKV